MGGRVQYVFKEGNCIPNEYSPNPGFTTDGRCNSVSGPFSAVWRTRAAAKGRWAELTELDQVSQLLISLPASYDVVTTAVGYLMDDRIKLDVVKARLLAEDRKRFQINQWTGTAGGR